MCGIAGFVEGRGSEIRELEPIGVRMANALLHRGPDDHGVWGDAETRVCLSHRRLSILDLSPLGHQPMMSSCGRYVISFNGEIYNYRAIRQELESAGSRFKGGSDTEVMLEAISHWGLLKATRKFLGMFAFAVWDKYDRKLHLVRDRIGEKPLYYGFSRNTFLFGSELKA